MDKRYAGYYATIGANISYYRKKRKLSQYGLSLKSNISRAYISQIEAENVEKTPSLDILFRICEVLKIEPYQLFLKNRMIDI